MAVTISPSQDNQDERGDSGMPSRRRGVVGVARHAVAGALVGAARRISPQQAARSFPLPEQQVQSAAQAAYAASKQQAALRSYREAAPKRRLPILRRDMPTQTATGYAIATGQPDTSVSALNAGAFDTQMQLNQAPQATTVYEYAPGAPLPVVPTLPPDDGPRQFAYPIGYNITPQPRTTEATTFAQLRGLAFAYYGIGLCERVYYDVIAGLDLKITFKPNVIPDGESEDDPAWQAVKAPAEQFLRKPDGITDLTTWLTASTRDVLELGQSFIYRRRNRMGRILGLDIVDAATIKPLIDERGRMPLPPYPAYEQYLYGVPAYYLAANEVEWIREAGRSDSSYSKSRVEDIIINVNMALQKQTLDLARYTDGAIPQGIMTAPDQAYTADQLETYEQMWNGLLAGNPQQRVRVKFAPAGMTFTSTQPNDPLIEFDRFLLNTCVAAYGLTMDELGMTDTSNKSVGQSQQAVVYRRAVKPLVTRHAKLLTQIVQEEFDPRLVVTFAGYEEEEDQLMKAQTMDIGVKNGSLSPARFARMMGWPVDLEVPPMIVTKDGPIWLEDAMNLREAQQKAKLAGLEFAIGAPGQAQDPTSTSTSTTPSPSPTTSSASATDTSAADATDDGDEDTPPHPQKPAASVSSAPTSKRATAPKAPVTNAQTQAQQQQQQRAVSMMTETPPIASTADPALIREEYRRWRTVALRAVKAGKRVPSFASVAIPVEDYALLASDLTRCASADDVRAAFLRAKAREQQPLIRVAASPATVTSLGTLPRDMAAQYQSPAGVQHARHALSIKAQHIFDEARLRGSMATGVS